MGDALRVIGIGNPDRGDDGIGPAVAARVAEIAGPGVGVSIGEPLDLMDQWEGASAVVVVDAIVDGSPPGTIRVIDASDGQLLADVATLGSHGLGVATAIELARSLDRLPSRLTLVGVSVDCVEGDGLSGPVAGAVAGAAERVLEVLAYA